MIDDKKSRLIEKIKNSIIELVHYSEDQLKTKFSEHISKKLYHDYNYLSNLFSEVEGTTIEKYFIAQKIEKVKELLKYDGLSLSEIADRLGYSSVAYLSNQFKKQTGLTPTLVKGDLHGIVKAKKLSKAVMKNIHQNLWFAFIYNVIGISIAEGILYPVFGILLSPMIAAVAMSFSSVSVIANSLRLRNVKL